MGQNKAGGKPFTEPIPQNWSFFFILFLAILGTYYQSLPYPLINLDDPYYITSNPYIRDLSWQGIYKIFSRPVVDNYFPLQILTYAFDYKIWHVQPFGYRLHNVVLHILNASLIFLLLKKLFSNPWVSFVAALLFGLHPVNVESVTWVAERKNVLSMALMLLSFFSYIYYLGEQRPKRRRGFYLTAISLFLLALLAKVSAVVIPLLFILYDLCFQKRRKWEMIRDKIPFLVLAILFSVITVWIYGKGGYLAAYHGGSPYTNFLAMINVFVEYVIYLVVPVYLDHYYWTAIPQSIFSRQVLLSIAAIFLMGVLAWRSFRKERIFFFWLGWFFISLLPVLNIVPLVILRADRYMYLPAIGLFYLVSWGLWKISRVEYRPFRLPVFLFCSFLVAGTYAFLTLERNKLWKDPLIFWEESLRKFPQSVAPYVYIGGIYAREGKDDLATSYYRSGLRENPNNVALLNGLAIAYKNKNELKKAEDLLEQASRLNPEDGGTYNNLGIVFFKKGDIEKARIYLQKALEIDPQNAAARTNLGVIFYRQKQWEEATRQFEKALDPPLDSIEPYLNLGLIYEQKKLLDKAESYLKKALDYDPRSYSALFLLGRVSLEKGNILQARFYLSQAHRLKPDDGDTNYFLGWITQREADDYFQKAMKRSPPAQAKFIEPSMNIHVRP